MKVKNLIFFILLCLTSIVTNGQQLFTQEISNQERVADRKRAELKISQHKWTKSDSTYFYVENYNKNGQIISHYDSEFDITKYDYNSFGKRIRAIEMVDNRVDTVWEAHYIGDTLLFKVLRDNDSKYIEELIFDSLEREVKRYKKYRKSEKTDSIITTYNDTSRVEIQFKNGTATLKIFETLNSSSSSEKYLRYINNDSTFHYLTWLTKFDLKGNETSRVQQFYDRDEKTEYITTYTDKGLEETSKVKTNGKEEFETTNFYDNDNRLVKSIYQEQDYRTVSEYFYGENNLESKSKATTYKKGQKPETETFISTYELYTDK